MRLSRVVTSPRGSSRTGQTADAFLIRSVKTGAFRDGWLILEECSQLSHYVWCQLLNLHHMGVKFILLGDENQLQAIGDCFQGRPCCLKFDNAMLRALAGSNRLVLTEGRRSDMNLFGFYQKLSLGGDYHSLPLQEEIQLARAAFPKQPRDAKFNLVISHRQREQLIREIQTRELARKRAEGAECVVLAPSYSGGANRAQEL